MTTTTPTITGGEQQAQAARYTLFEVHRRPVLVGNKEVTQITFLPCRDDPFFQMPSGVMHEQEAISVFTTNPEVARFFCAASLQDTFIVIFTKSGGENRLPPSTNPALQVVHGDPGSTVRNVRQSIEVH